MNLLHKTLIAAIVMAILYTAALGVRRAILDEQYRLVGADMPFTLESALQYRRVKIVYDTGSMPEMDAMIQHPEGVNVRKTYNYGPEVVQAWLAKRMPESMSVAHRLRWIESGWFCLGIPLMALWLLAWKKSWWGAAIAAGFYAVNLGAAIRSTGQELSRENFALPLLAAHLAARAWSLSAGRRAGFLAGAAGSAFFLWAAFASWDLIQFYVYVWVAAELYGTARGREASAWSRGKILWMAEAAGLLAAGLLVPYHRAHGWLVSPAMAAVYGVALYRMIASLRSPPSWIGGRWRWALILGPLALVLAPALAGSYGASYGHFGELLWAKIRHLNVKPEDPGLLTFYQRIMWVPALHSATLPLTFELFPVMLVLAIVAAPFVYLQARSPGTGRLIFSFGASLVAFCFFARFHVFLTLFSSALLGAWGAWAGARLGWARIATLVLLLGGLAAEASHTVRDPQRWGRPNVYYRELAELAGWLREHIAPEPVLANFGVGSFIAAYAKCPIFLHPKFESGEARRRVQSYGEALFRGTEKDFRDWCDDLGARYYVHSMGEFAPVQIDQQMRYMVDAVNPREDAAGRVLEARPLESRYFKRLWGNRKYVVFAVLTNAEEQRARALANRAALAFEHGDLDIAERDATAALAIDGGQDKAAKILLHVSSLRESGFGYSRERK